MLATLRATSRTLHIVQEKFPDIHGKDNIANAFRHALWNMLIASKCFQIEGDLNLVLSWTKRVADWHEDFSPNAPLPKAMDLHNNQIGRELFRECQGKDEEVLVTMLTSQLKSAVQVSSLEALKQCPDNLVFIHHDT